METINETALLAAGYQQYPVPSFMSADACYQKIVRDEAGVRLYAIDISRYTYERHQPGAGVGWMATMRFHLGAVFGDISLTLRPETTLSWVEGWLAMAHRRLGAIPDPHND